MDVILLTRIQGTEEYPEKWLEDLAVEMEKYGDILQQAEEAVFCGTDGGWEFQYLKRVRLFFVDGFFAYL